MKTYSGKGTIAFDNEDVYEGAFQYNEPDGVGKMTYSDGRVCEGIWKKGNIEYEGELNENGKPHGRGKWIYSIGTYDGEWKNGKKHGKGTFKWADGSSYEGEWKDDKGHGKGVEKYADGSVLYDGKWKDNKKHGKGILKCPDGSVLYDGEYKDNMLHENGTLNYPNGDVYKGEWRANYMHGRGVMTYANQDIYDGQWKDDSRDGQGKMKYHNGDVYEGEFSKNKMHGKGTITYAAGEILKSTGEWKEGKKCGLFEDTIRTTKQVHYENGEVKPDSNITVKREASFDADTDTEDAPSSKRRNVSISPR